MRTDFVLFLTEFCWKFSNNNLNHRHKHQFPDDYRERPWRRCLLEQKQSETTHLWSDICRPQEFAAEIWGDLTCGCHPPRLPGRCPNYIHLTTEPLLWKAWIPSVYEGYWLQRDKNTDLRFPSAIAVITLTTSHWVCAGMQESQCTRDSVDWGNVLGTL